MKKQNQKWFSILTTFIMFFTIVTPAAMAKQTNQPSIPDSKQLANLKNKLLQHRKELNQQKIDHKINIKSNDPIKVIVEFNEVPMVVQQHNAKKQKIAFQAAKQQEKLTNERTQFKAHLQKKGLRAKVGQSFEKVFNGLAMEVTASDVPKLAEDPNVKAVYLNNKVEAVPLEPATKNVPYMGDSAPFIGTDELWKLGYEGQGKKIGVIDTGIDYHHPDLKDAYKGGYDFVDNDPDPFEGDDGTQVIDTTHGTHVSGIIAGRGTYEAGGTRGIAPKSDLYVYRVLGPDGGWDEWVIAGIEKAVEDGMDVINLSLGNGVNDPDQPTSRAVNNAMLAGVVAVVANGNNGSYGYSTVGAPGTSALAISVGASFPPINQAIFQGKASATDKEYTLNWMMKWEPTAELIDPLFAEREMVYLGFGKAEDFSGKDLSGKIALIKRGESMFAEANQRAYAAGAVGVIFFNLDGTNEHINHPFPQEGPLPMFDMSGEDGRALIEKMAANPKNTFTFTAQNIDRYPGDELGGFSSKGPVLRSWDIKPDLVAPGVNIRSTIPGIKGDYKNAYERYSGTSMAAPHIAGLAALLLEAHPDWNPFDVKTALMNTSKTIAPLANGKPYTVQEIGAGRVQALPALQTPVLAEVKAIASYTKDPLSQMAEEQIEHQTGSINFGIVKAEEPVHKTITLKGLTDSAVSYKVSYDLKYLYSLGDDVISVASDSDGVTLTLDQADITVPALGTADLDVSVFMPTDAGTGFYYGYVYLTPVSDGAKPIQLPFMAYNNPRLMNPIAYIDPNPKFLSLNGDGKDESTNLEYRYLSNMQVGELYLWSETDYNIYGKVTEFTGEDLKQGIHSYQWNGSFYDLDSGEKRVVPSGLYYLYLQAQDEFGNWYEYEIPYIVSNEPTDIKVDQETTDASGQHSVIITENKLHGMITSTAVQIYRDFNFEVTYPYYWNLVSMEYELYDSGNKLLSKGEVSTLNDFETPEKHLEYTLKDIFPNGKSRLVLRVKDKAGNENEQTYQVSYNQPTGVEFIGKPEVEIGQTYELTLQANQVKDMVGAEYIISYPSKVLSLKSIQPVSGFAASELSYEDVKTFVDQNGTEMTTVKVVTDLRKDPKEHKKPKKDMVGVNGNIQTGKLIFTAVNRMEKIGNYRIKSAASSYTTMNLEKKQLMGSEKPLELYTKSGSFSGFIKPEALLDANGKLRNDINYGNKEGTRMEIYQSKNGYGKGGEKLGAFDGYRTELGWSLEADGSFQFYGLNPMEKYDLVIVYPSHFTAVMRGIQPAKLIDGKLTAADIPVDFGILKAGDVFNENPLDEKIDIYDVANISRNLGKKAVDGRYDFFWTKGYDVDKDGQINERDLNYSVRNFDLKNKALEGISIEPPVDQPPNEDAPVISLKTDHTTVKKGEIIPVKVELTKTQQVYALQYGFTYDSSLLQLVDANGKAAAGGQMGEMFSGNTILLKNKNGKNRIEFAASHKGDATAELKDTGVVMTYYFKVLKDSSKSTSLTWDRSALRIIRESYGSVNVEWQQATENLALTLKK